MPVNYDDVVNKNKRNLTKAQIKKLAEAAQRYEALNAGNRADAAASARAQYDAGYRGLQNMGLAGGLEAQAKSGEVPRLKAEIQTPFDQYQQKLRDVEHKQMAALGTAFAQQTKRRRRAEAEARAKAEAEAAEARARAEAEAREAQRLSASMKQTATESRGMSGSTITSDIKRQRNVNTTDSGTGGQGYTNKMDQLAARDMQVKLQAAAQLIGGTAMGIATSIATGTVKSALGLRTPTMQDIQNAENAAAARVLGMSVPATPYESMQQSVARGNMRAAEAQDSGYDNGDLTGRVKGPTVKTQDQLDARANLRQAEDALRSINRQVRDGYDAEADRQAYETAQKEFEQAEKAFNAERGRGAGSTIGAGNKRQRSLDMTDSGSDLSQTVDSSVSKATAQAYQLAKARRDAAQLKAEQPKLYASYVVIENDDADPAAREEAAKEIMKSWGYDPDERTEEQFKTDRKTVAKYASYLATLDDQNATPEERNAAEVQLKALGVTPDQARKFISDHRQARIANGEYNYYKNALMNQLTYAGKAPTRPVNQDELDPLYRAVNNLATWEEDTVNANFAEGSPSPDATTSEEYVGNELRYLTDDERNAYNYIYETQGLAAANKYIRDGLPLRNIRAAAEDKAYAEQLVKDSPVAASLLSIGANTFGNVPAMLEKIVKGTYNYMTGSNNELFIDTNNATHRLADIGNLIQSETSRRILGDSPNPTRSAKVWNFVYQTGMSMAQSAVAMTIASAGPSWITDAMFFSSAGNEAYKDAMERGATQEQALAYSFLNGAAEAVFEHASIEHFLNLDYQGKGRLLKNMVSQAFVEADEEVNTELANILSDALIMKDKSQYNLAVQEYMRKVRNRKVMTEEEARKQALLDQVKNVSMAGLGGLASGLGFGAFGAIPNAISQTRRGREVKTKHAVDGYMRMANLLGGDAARMAQEVNDSYGIKKSKNGSIETTEQGNIKTQEPGNRLVGALAQQVDRQMQELADTPDKGAAVERLLEGEKITTNAAKEILNTLGADTLQEMGYDTASPSVLAKSYNARLQEYSVQPAIVSEGRQAIQSGIDRRYEAIKPNIIKTQAQTEEKASRVTQSEQQERTSGIWKDPNIGYTYTEAGQRVKGMPGNITSVSYEEQERNNFAPRTTIKTGNVTYQIAGMEAREGLTDKQKIEAIKENMDKGHLVRSEFLESLSSALGVNIAIHDDMNGNGYLDKDGTLHFSLSSKQSVLRVASHELTHLIRRASEESFTAIKDSIIKQVGQERFDQKVETKKREYARLGVELNQDTAIEETVTDYSERMLSDTDFLEEFVDEHPAAARTLKDVLLKVVNAVKRAFKRSENRNYGQSWSNEIEYTRETLEAMYKGLETVMERAQKTDGKIEQENADELYMSEETRQAEDLKKQVQENAKKKTYVRGYTAAEVDSVLAAGVVGNRSNYDGDDYENARGMVAQLIPDVVSALKGDKDAIEVMDRVKAAVSAMYDTYFEDTGDMSALRDIIPTDIGVDRTGKGDLKAQDTTLFQMSSKLSHALGKPVHLVGVTNAQGQKNKNHQFAEKLEDLWPRVRDRFGLSDEQDFTLDIQRLLDFIEQQGDTRKNAQDLFGSTLQNEIDATANNIIDAVSDMLSEKEGKRYSLDVDALREERTDADYMRLAEKYKSGTATAAETEQLQKSVAQEAKRMGFDSPLLYHGTNAFGFKSFDLTKGEGYIFASSSRDTAETYSGVTNRSQIADESRINVDELHGEQLLKEAQKHLDGYAGYELMTQQDRENATKHARRELTKTLERAAEFVNDNEGAFDEGKMAVMDDLLNALSNLSDARTEDDLMDAWDRWQGAIWDLKDMDDSIAVEFLHSIYSQNLALQKRHLDDLLYTGDLYKDRDAIGSYVFDNQLALELDAALHRGIYSLYGKTGRSLVIDADGANWNQIQAPAELLLNGPQNTRAIADAAFAIGYDSVTIKNVRDNGGATAYNGLGDIYIFNAKNAVKSADPVTYDDAGNIIPLSLRFMAESPDIRYSLDTDAVRQAFTLIDTEGIEDGLEALKDVKHVGSFALKDISRFLDASAGKNKDLRNTLHAIFEAPHSEATGRYARGVERMQNRVMDIAKRAGVVDAKGRHFDSKKSAAIQNIGEGFSNTYTNLKLKVKDAEHVTVQAYDPDTGNLVVSEKDYTLKELRQAYGTNATDYVWDKAYNQAENAQATGGERGWIEETVNTRPYTLADLQTAFPNDWQQLKAAADEFRQMYDEYIRDQNNMLATIYPIESEYDSEDKLQAAIEKKQERLEQHKTAVNVQLDNLQKRLEAKEQEMAGKKRTDTKAFRDLIEQANRIGDQIASVKSEIAEYEAKVKEELVKLAALKAEYQNARQRGESDSLSRMHRLQYRSDYFHHFYEMANGIQNLKAIFTNNTDQDIAPQIVGKSENTKAKTRWAGYFQQRMGGDYTADAINGMLRYGQLAEYKLAFDPLTAYLRDVTEQIRKLDTNATNRDGLIRYLMAWTDNIAGKSHKIDRVVSDAGMAPRKAMQILQWINSRVIQNTLLFNMRSALIQISNITNAKSIVKNNLDWMNGLRSWALAAKGDAAMASVMQQSNFLASRYMDNLSLTDSKLKSAKAFAGWMLGALDEVSAKATWWAAYQSYTRNPNVAKNQYRSYADAVDYADDVTRRTHAGRGVGELAPAMTSRVVNFVAPFQVEVNNTWQLLKDNVKQRNYLGLLSTGVSVFLFNAAFEAIVGSTPLGFDFIRAVMDIVLGYTNDDDNDDPTVTSIAQRLAGELVGGLPFAAQLVSILGEDNAKKLLGEDNDATRYGNTQIGVSAVMNAVKGLKDIGTGLIQGRRVNWIDDLDDLLNLTMPMGAKQLTRSAQGIATVAKGYAGKYDKEGNEKVQFVTDQDILHYIHAGLFGKWALREASEYFGEERLLPKLFGKYEGPKSATGQMIDAKEYKAALETGIDGKDYFSLTSDLKEYTTQAGKRAELMQKNLTPEQKAKLDALMVIGKNGEAKTEGSVVYQKNSEGEWKVKADYSNQDMFDLSTNGDKVYTGTLDAMEKTGLPQDQAALAASMWEQAKTADDNKQAFRDLLRDNNNLTVAQKEALDLQYTGNKYPADYSDPDLYELSTTNRSQYEKAKTAKKQGIPVKVYTGLSDKKSAYTGEDKADYMRAEIMKMNLTAKQKEALDDLLVSDKGRNPDYSSPAWFEISMLGGGQYNEAKQGEKVGLKPETYLTVYKKYKTIDAKDENGKTRSGLKKRRCKEYLDSLSISAPVYDYIWTAMFGYKSR